MNKEPKFERLVMVNENYGMLEGGIIGKMHEESRRAYSVDYVAPTLHCCGGGNLEPKIIEPVDTGKAKVKVVIQLPGYEQNGRVYDSEGISPCIAARDYKDAKKIIEPFIVASRGRNPDNPSDITEQRLEPNTKGGCNTLTSVQKDNYVCENYRIRKLTPLECWRLMGFDDDDFYAAQNAGISNTQLYKQAGNSIVVDVLEELFCMMFDEQGEFYV